MSHNNVIGKSGEYFQTIPSVCFILRTAVYFSELRLRLPPFQPLLFRSLLNYSGLRSYILYSGKEHGLGTKKLKEWKGGSGT